MMSAMTSAMISAWNEPTDADRAVADTVRAAVASKTPLRIVGAGTWLDGGQPVHATHVVSLASDTGVVAYIPGDLVITVRAGTTLQMLDATLSAHGQWLPLDPDGGAAVTIGAVAATCSYGPLAEWYGTPRDHILGMTVVTGTGDIIMPGGRVVKNVAGFDVTRLMIGAWGTLGIITQVTLRVRARPRAGTTATQGMEHLRRPKPTPYGTPYGYREPIITVPALSRGIKRTFDPHDILNPGIMGETT